MQISILQFKSFILPFPPNLQPTGQINFHLWTTKPPEPSISQWLTWNTDHSKRLWISNSKVFAKEAAAHDQC